MLDCFTRTHLVNRPDEQPQQSPRVLAEGNHLPLASKGYQTKQLVARPPGLLAPLPAPLPAHVSRAALCALAVKAAEHDLKGQQNLRQAEHPLFPACLRALAALPSRVAIRRKLGAAPRLVLPHPQELLRG
jgi:hypothetical protein